MPQAFDLAPFFLDSPRGPLFCLHTAPTAGTPRSAILYLHAFAEEMHKSRRMAAMQARALAAAGHAVLQIDLTGCGDSAGDFGDADWAAWRDDARRAHAWLVQRGDAPISLWGLRTGALLAADVARELPGLQRLLLWQPVQNGDLFLNQFLRIKLASEMLAEGQAQSGAKALRAQLAQGAEVSDGVEIGGYWLSPAMARSLGALKLADMTPPCPVIWLETGASIDADAPALTPASQRVIDAWRAQGTEVTSRAVSGDPFWVTQEITECPALIAATLASLDEGAT